MAQRDQTGATRFITPETVVSALHGVKHGRLIDLSHTIHAGVPMMVPFHAPFTLSTWCTPDRTRKMIREAFKVENEVGVTTEQVTMGMHTGTHIDALGHISMAEEMYGGISTRDAVGDFGLDFLGIENCPWTGNEVKQSASSLQVAVTRACHSLIVVTAKDSPVVGMLRSAIAQGCSRAPPRRISPTPSSSQSARATWTPPMGRARSGVTPSAAPAGSSPRPIRVRLDTRRRIVSRSSSSARPKLWTTRAVACRFAASQTFSASWR